MKIAVIGAGPAGLTAAYALTKAGAAVDVYEASDAVGGLAKSLQLWGQTVDLGPHRFFSHNKRVNELWLEIVGADYRMIGRRTRILYRGKFFQYPLEPSDAFRNLGPVEAARCVWSYAFQKLRSPTSEETFESWVCGQFGRRLFEIFFRSYSEKLWGIPCDRLDADFAAQRIKTLSLAGALRSAFSRVEQTRHRTLADEFAYPIHGTGMVYERMAQAVQRRGGRILLRAPVQRVETSGGRASGLALQDGTIRNYDCVVSSMPLTVLVTRLVEAPDAVTRAAQQLRFRNTILVYLEIDSPSVCPDQWIYIHSPELRTGRITNFRNWTPELHGGCETTILAMEYWCDEGDALWNSADAQLIELAQKELLATGLVRNRALIRNAAVYRIPKCYPVYERGYKERLRPIQDYLRQIEGLEVIGRYGAFKYNNQDHSILMGILAAENILTDARHDLWSVNADYENYQERYAITETGLVRVSSHSRSDLRQPGPCSGAS